MRALGYSDSAGGDFSYENALAFSDKIGMTNGVYALDDTFLRRDMVWLSTGALFQPMKDTSVRLIQKLNRDGKIDTERFFEGLMVIMKADMFEENRYIKIQDNSGAPNHIVDSYSLYTVPGTGQYVGYEKLCGYPEESIYPMYYKINDYKSDLGYEFQYRLVKTDSSNLIRYESYRNGLMEQMIALYYYKQHKILFDVDIFEIPPIYIELMSDLLISNEKNNIDDLTYIVNGVCNDYNDRDTPYNGKLSVVVDSGTSITITHNIPDTLPLDEEEKIKEIENVIKNVFSETLNNKFPEHIDIHVKTSVDFASQEQKGFDKEWISSKELEDIYNFKSQWFGEEIWIGRTALFGSGEEDITYTLTGSPAGTFEKGKIYKCSYNGDTIKVQYDGGLLFDYSDLCDAGIIEE